MKNILLALLLATAVSCSTVPEQKKPQIASPQLSETKEQFEIVPKGTAGDLLNIFYAAYGAAQKKEGPSLVWKRNGYDLRVYPVQQSDIASQVTVSVKKGTVVRTPDGFLLGKDTFSDVLTKAKGKNLQLRERIKSGDGMWMLEAYFPSSGAPNNLSVYVWVLPGSDSLDGQIDNGTSNLNSSPFLNEVVREYSVETSSFARHEQLGGTPSVHTTSR